VVPVSARYVTIPARHEGWSDRSCTAAPRRGRRPADGSPAQCSAPGRGHSIKEIAAILISPLARSPFHKSASMEQLHLKSRGTDSIRRQGITRLRDYPVTMRAVVPLALSSSRSSQPPIARYVACVTRRDGRRAACRKKGKNIPMHGVVVLRAPCNFEGYGSGLLGWVSRQFSQSGAVGTDTYIRTGMRGHAFLPARTQSTVGGAQKGRDPPAGSHSGIRHRGHYRRCVAHCR